MAKSKSNEKMKKMKRNIYSALAMALAITATAGLVSCQAEMDDPGLVVPEASIKANTTILELKQAYENKIEKVGFKPGTEKYDADGNVVDGEHIIIHGRVVSSDASGNIYKSLVIQDETASLAFSINSGSLYNFYRLGQDVVVDMTGLYLGYYYGLQQVGSPSDTELNGENQLGFMALDYMLRHAQCDGLPSPEFAKVKYGEPYPTDQFYCLTFDSFDELTKGTLPELQSQLVEFRNVSFQIEEEGQTYAPYESTVSRYLVDANGQTLTVRNSGYSNFYYKELPKGRGIVRGILSYYNSGSATDPWQLILRDVTDVIITEAGEEATPFSVSDVRSGEYDGLIGWTSGYIVGAVKAGVTTVTSAADVTFGKDVETFNNVLIAESADETDINKCIVVDLPQGTSLRTWVNLIDNPEFYKAQLLVNGKISTELGLPAIVDSKGGFNEFRINGKSMSGGTEGPAPAGDGTEANPYNVSWVKASTEDKTGVWVIGYVAGYVATGSDFTGDACEFSANEVPGSTAYLNSNNVILSSVAPMKCGVDNSVPAQLSSAVRSTLGLKLNPGIYGKQVMIKCNIEEYFGTRGIRKITEVREL